MRTSLVGFVLAMACSTTLAAQGSPTRIALTPSSNVPSAQIVKHLRSSCPDVVLTTDLAKADYTLEASESKNAAGTRAFDFQFTLFNKDGDAVYTTSPRRITNAVKDVCTFIEAEKKKSHPASP